MQAITRNGHYSLSLKIDEVGKIGKDSSLQAKLYDENSGGIDTGKSLHLGLGGNRYRSDASLRESEDEIYVKITKATKRRLLTEGSVLAKYNRGTINLQVEVRG